MTTSPATPTRHDNRIRIAPLVEQHLEYYIREITALLPKDAPGIKMDKNAVVTEIVMDFLAGKGHWPPKWAKDGEPIDVSKRVEEDEADLGFA